MSKKRAGLPRRTFLKWSAALAGASVMPLQLTGCGGDTGDDDDDTVDAPPDPGEIDGGTPLAFSAADVPHDDALFPCGVQAGAMTAAAALLWTYITDAAPVRLRVWRDSETDGEVFLVKDEVVTPSEGGYVKHPVDTLAPGAVYRYAMFREDGETLASRTLVGRFRTALPEGSLEPLTFSAATCTKMTQAPWRALTLMGQEPTDALLHLGDMSYNDGATTLEDYRELWRQTLEQQGYLDALASTGMYITWDDHEIDNNYDPETIDPAHFEAGRDAFFETVAAAPGPEGQLWGSYRWGDTAEIIVLDCRSERRPSTRETDAPIYIGAEQMAWFKQRLLESPCRFKIVLNSVPMTQGTVFWDLALADRWEGYEAQREEVLGFIEDNGIADVWFLSGDFHTGFVARLEREGFRRNMWEIAVGPTGNPNGIGVVADEGFVDPRNLFPEDQFEYASSRLAATFLTFDPADGSVRVRFIDAETDEARFDARLTDGGVVLED